MTQVKKIYPLENTSKNQVKELAEKNGIKVTFPSDHEFKPHGNADNIHGFLVELTLLIMPA